MSDEKINQDQTKTGEIDFFAASHKRRPGRPRTNPIKPKRPRGRPTTAAIKEKPAKTLKPSNLYNIYNRGNGVDDKILLDYDKAAKLTPQEITFIEYYVLLRFRIIPAMERAGFIGSTNTYKYLLAKKIIEKYERQAEDHRNIFRAVGLGEIAVAKGILKACQVAKTTKELTDAYGLAAKCLGLQREVIEGGQGITLIITGQGEESGEIKEPGKLAEPQKALPPPAMIRD